jgi:hypothetical protein
MATINRQHYKPVEPYKIYYDYEETLSPPRSRKQEAHHGTKTVLPLHYGDPIRRHQHPIQHTKHNQHIVQIPIKIHQNDGNDFESPSFTQIPVNIIEVDQTKSKDYVLNENFNEIYKKNLRKLSTNERQRQMFFKNRIVVNTNQASPNTKPITSESTTPKANQDYLAVEQPNIKQHRDLPSSILSKLSTFAVNVQQKAQIFNRSNGAVQNPMVSALLPHKRFQNGPGNQQPATQSTTSSPMSIYSTSSKSSTNSPSSSPTSSISSINNLNFNSSDNTRKSQNQTWLYDEVFLKNSGLEV